MTICISAMAENDYVVVASDRMVTLSLPSTEFEQNISKTIKVADSCVSATAGNALAYSPVHLEALKQLQQDSKSPNTHRIAELIRKGYVKARNEKLEQDVLAKMGMSLQSFYERNQKLSPNIIANLSQAMAQYNYGLTILVAGVDSNGPHIFRIDDPGIDVAHK